MQGFRGCAEEDSNLPPNLNRAVRAHGPAA